MATHDKHPNKYVGTTVSFSRNAPRQTARDIQESGSQAISMFMHGKLAYTASPLPESAIHHFLSAIKGVNGGTFNDSMIVAHATYAINLATKDDEKYAKSIAALQTELTIGGQLGIDFVFHPGFRQDKDMEAAANRIAEAINDNINTSTSTPLLEIMAKKTNGTVYGKSFEELAAVITRCRDKERIGVCLDTAHMFASGYDLRTEQQVDDCMRQFNRVVGPQYLRAVHLNDSVTDFNSGKDEHAPIGRGKIGLPCFKWIMNNPQFDDIPMVTETHLDMAQSKKEIELLYDL